MGPDGLRCAGGAKVSGQRCLSRDIRYIDALGSPFCAHHGDQGVQPVLAFPAADDALETAPTSRAMRETGRPSEAPKTPANDVPEAPFQGVVPASPTVGETGRPFEAPETPVNTAPNTSETRCAGTTKAGERCKATRYLNFIAANGDRYCRAHAEQGHAERFGSIAAVEQQKADPNRPHPREGCAGRRRDGTGCPSLALWYLVDDNGNRHAVCDWHMKLGVLDPPPKLRDGKQGGRRHGTVVADDAPKKKPRKRGNLNPLPAKTPHDAELIRPDVVVEDEEAVVIANGSRQVGPKEMRATLQSDIAASYDSVQRAILDALSAETSIWATCRQCSTRMKIAIPATAERLRAASLALDVFGKPPVAPAEVAPDIALTREEIARLSNDELANLLSRARPAPHSLPRERKFAPLIDDIAATRDVIARHQEGMDVSRRELQQASLRVAYWSEMAQMLAPFVGMTFDPEEARR